MLMEFDYDANGNRTRIDLNGVPHTSYAYDNADRLTTLTDDAGQPYTYAYDLADRLISKALPNGVTTTYEYDNMSRLTRLKDATIGSTLLDRQYAYNAANQISGITEPSRTRTFTYDNVNRLTGAADTLGNETYAFDAVGNRTSSHLSATYTHQTFNRLTAATGITQTFDANGNTATKTQSGVAWTYTWDRENRLTQAASTGATVQFVYDALGRRVRRTHGSTDTKFTHDGEDVLLDDDPLTGITKYQNGPGIDNKLSTTTGANTAYFLADHLGSTNALTDGTGAISSQGSYDSFGNPTGNLATRYQFTGREFDPTINLQFSRARFYDPKLGRFTSEDPIGFGGGDVNLYGYTRNRPTSLRDPSGQSPAIIVLGFVAAELGLHTWLFYRAYNLFPQSCDPQGRKKHCYVNCMSARFHGFHPVVPTIASLGQEAQTLIPKYYLGGFEVEVAESASDMAANFYGMSNSVFVSKSCYSICMEYSQ